MIKNKSHLLGIITISFFIYVTHIWIDFFYIATYNVDFSKYYDYLNYFLGLDVQIDFGQGVLYYFLISTLFRNRLDNLELSNMDIILSSTIHNINLLLFIFGLLGIYKLLISKGISNLNCIISLIALVLFPQAIYMRAVMKPEILCFAVLPWCVYFVERYFQSKNILYLFYSLPFLVISLNTKASAAGMVLLFLLFSYNKIFKVLEFKKILILLLVLIMLILIIQFENYLITDKTPFERPYDPEYDYKANYNILFRFSPSYIIESPFFNYDYQDNYYNKNSLSAINLILLDTFGDYFNQLFDSRVQYFSKNRKDFLTTGSTMFINENREINYEGPLSGLLITKMNYIRKLLAACISFIFFSLVIYYIFKDRENRHFYLAPFFGLFVLYLNSIGIPTNNFNLLKGDTFKAFYFSFLLCICFAFVFANIFQNSTIIKVLVLFIFSVCIIFISGHPKVNSQSESERLVAVNEYSLFCEVNNILIFENKIIKNIHKSGNIYNYKSDCNKKTTSNDLLQNNRKEYDLKYENDCINKIENKENIQNENASISNICRIYTIEKAKAQTESPLRIPFFSLLLLFIAFFFSIKKGIFDEKIN